MSEPRYKLGETLIGPGDLRWEVWTVEGEGEERTYILSSLETPLHDTERVSASIVESSEYHRAESSS